MEKEDIQSIRMALDAVIKLLRKCDSLPWADELMSIRSNIVNMNVSDVQKMMDSSVFGGMGSLTDVSLHVEGDARLTIDANQELSRLLDQLYQAVYKVS
jgi:hypothetical protein